MICPSCKGYNELTWKRYLLTFRDRYTCDHCHERFRVRRTFKHFSFCVMLGVILVLPIIFIADSLGASITVLRYTLIISVISVISVTLAVFLPIDKKYLNTKGQSTQ